MKLVLCASVAFYKHVNELANLLNKAGYEAIVPATATKMMQSGDYEVAKYKTWYDDAADFHRKKSLMDGHFAEIANGDAVLIVNDEKHGVSGYIGPNVLMEMAIAYYLNKPIYVLHDVDALNTVYEEVMGLECIQLDGNIANIKKID